MNCRSSVVRSVVIRGGEQNQKPPEGGHIADGKSREALDILLKPDQHIALDFVDLQLVLVVVSVECHRDPPPSAAKPDARLWLQFGSAAHPFAGVRYLRLVPTRSNPDANDDGKQSPSFDLRLLCFGLRIAVVCGNRLHSGSENVISYEVHSYIHAFDPLLKLRRTIGKTGEALAVLGSQP
jgi:hypothetical protein